MTSHDRSLFGPKQPADAAGIDIQSGVSVYSGDGFVTLHWGKEHGQLTPAEARAHGAYVIAAAEAAEHDAAVYAVLRRLLDDGTMTSNHGKRGDAVAARFLDDLREERARREERS